MVEPSPTLAALRARYVTERQPLPRRVEQALRADPRPGAAAILEAVARLRRARRAEVRRLRGLLAWERVHWDAGVRAVAGVDEAGMSPMAGPVVAAAVILRPGVPIEGVDDSKKLAPATRETLAATIRAQALCWCVGWVEPAEIDRLNVYHAGLLAMRRAVEGLALAPEVLLVDARTVPGQSVPQEPIIRGDQKSLSIAAASILAKTTRDARMVAMDALFPGYGFAKHKGYPVAAHKAALARLGPTPIHRRSFPAVRAALGED